MAKTSVHRPLSYLLIQPLFARPPSESSCIFAYPHVTYADQQFGDPPGVRAPQNSINAFLYYRGNPQPRFRNHVLLAPPNPTQLTLAAVASRSQDGRRIQSPQCEDSGEPDPELHLLYPYVSFLLFAICRFRFPELPDTSGESAWERDSSTNRRPKRCACPG